ncbi:MAG: DEAD/DEAH box helicase, partial [Deltaproteobacteria bacterium]|nr:DEAD/DEAH box helicase [Deltaproteobacteria bacterium]
MSDSASKFPLLHEKVQKWVWEQKWPSLREIQELSIEPILSGECDVILSASTASGKTEAAFLPAMSKLVEESPVGVGILCLSPLKALINDQFRRLESLGASTGEPVTPWHGDISESLKKSFLKNPQGALLITPESLESLLLNKGKWCQENLKNLQYFIIDEFHAFVGSERGRQLQSLLVRLDFLINRITPRIALSATLGDMERIAYALRPHGGFPQKILESHSKTELKLEMRGYLKSLAKGAPSETLRITDDLFKILRGK